MNRSQWLSWRREGIGSSDAPVVMEKSPWRTPLELWEEKTGRKMGDSSPNYAQQRGLDLEPKARAVFELYNDLDMEPALVCNSNTDYIRASLDGYNKIRNEFVEIKCPNRKDHGLAICGMVPEKYIWQVHHQFLVTGAEVGYYFSFDGKDGATVTLKRDKESIDLLLDKERKFWELIKADKAPPLTERDWKELENKSALQLASQYKEVSRKLDEVKNQYNELRKELESLDVHPRLIVDDVKIMKLERKGSVQYKNIPELEGVNVEDYRSSPTSYVKIEVSK